MSCEKGFRAMIDEAEFQMDEDEFTTWVEKFSGLPSHFDRAMLVYLDHNACWKGATRFYHVSCRYAVLLAQAQEPVAKKRQSNH